MNVSCACCSRCLHLELSFCRLQIVRTLSANASIASQACFGPHDSRMFCHGCVHYHPCFSRTFRLADFLGSFFTLVANVVTDLVAGKITKDYNGLNLKRLALFRLSRLVVLYNYSQALHALLRGNLGPNTLQYLLMKLPSCTGNQG